MTYLDFFLEVRASSGRKCRVTVRSPRGECDDELTLPLDLDTISELRADLHGHALRFASSPRDAGATGGPIGHREVAIGGFPKADTHALGRSLYDAIFQGEVAELFAASREAAKHQGHGLRVNLVTPDAALALIPWELLCSRHGDPVCLSERTPFVRYFYVGKPQAPLRVEPPLRVLGLLSVGGGGPLDLGSERSHIDAALAPLVRKSLAEVTWLQDPTSNDLLEALDSRDWHILHFAGHGTFDRRTAQGLLSIASEGGGHGHLRATDLRVLLRDRHSVRMVFLNACDGAIGDAQKLLSSTAALVAEAGVPAVLAMQFPVSDKSASKFARQVYRQIAAGDSIEEAVTEARKDIYVGGSLEWATPVLFMRSAEGAFLRPDDKRPGRPAPPTKTAGGPSPSTPPPASRSAVPSVPSQTPRAQLAFSKRVPVRTLVVAAALAALIMSVLAVVLANRWRSDTTGVDVAATIPPASTSASVSLVAPPKPDWSNPCALAPGVASWVAEVRAALCDREHGKPATAWRALDALTRTTNLDADSAKSITDVMTSLERESARLRVETSEQGIELVLLAGDQAVSGLTPQVNTELMVDPGAYTIVVRKAGTRERSVRVTAVPRKLERVNLPKAAAAADKDAPNERGKLRCFSNGVCVSQ